MVRMEKSVVIDAPVEEVFAYVLDPAHLPEYAVDINVVEVRDIKRLPNGGYSWTAISKIFGLRLEGKGEQTEVVPYERITAVGRSAAAELRQSVRFERLDDHKTRFTGRDELIVHAGPLASLGEPFLEKFLDKGSDQVMALLKAKIEAEARATAAH